MPSTLRVDTNLLRMVASADLTLRGTYDRPVLFGHADIERGEVNFEGRRYRITRGDDRLHEPDPHRAVLRHRGRDQRPRPGAGQTYRVTVGFAGTTEQLQPTVSSDPPLPTADVLALLFSDVRRATSSDARAARAAESEPGADRHSDGARDAGADRRRSRRRSARSSSRRSASTRSSSRRRSSIRTRQQTSRLNPTARLTIGKRISDRVYLTFSRSLGTTINDQIVLLEYDESDRLSWILSRNEDRRPTRSSSA